MIAAFRPFFALAMRSPTRQYAFRRAVVAHVLFVASVAWPVHLHGPASAALLGQALLVAGIVEGAVLIGWRLTQLPKSQALEYLLVSHLSAARLSWAEALVGMARLACVTLAGLPVLLLLAFVPGPDSVNRGAALDAVDFWPLLVMPATWGALTGLALTVWAFEPPRVRRWAERILLVLVAGYLTVGLLAGENLRYWLSGLPESVGQLLLAAFRAFHVYNGFAVMQDWFAAAHGLNGATWVPWERTGGVEIGALLAVALLQLRAAGRLKGHFHDLHYTPVGDLPRRCRRAVGERPLAWWAVRRVSRYSGRVNLWLASGCGMLYACYTVAGAYWPPWLGRQAFVIFDQLGGIPGLATALVLLAAVPAAFQYGLWDSSAHDRCRRLELLLLTELGARDYWEAAAAAAWRRGRGYLAVACLLWLAAVVAGQTALIHVTAALAASVILWALYFAVGFRAFSRGLPATGLGLLLTIGLPLLAYFLGRAGGPLWAAVLPPGSVYAAAVGRTSLAWLPGALAAGVATLLLARAALARCDAELRRWYAGHHGGQVLD